MAGVNVPLGSTWNNKGVKQAQQDLGTFQKQAKGFSSTISKSLLGVGAAFGGAFALSSITDQLGQMASAAAEDQKSVVSLAQALQNVGLGRASKDAEDFVKQLMLATGVADDQLRGALQQATTATGDFALSQRMVRDALDISAATGKDLSTVMTGLAKASLGNLGALTRLGIPLDANTVKSKDFGKALGELESRFTGQAAAAAETYAGQMQRLTMAVDEAKESIGYSLLGAIDDLGKSLGGTDGAVSGITALGDGIASVIDQSADGVKAIKAIYDALRDTAGASEEGSIQQEIWNKSFDAGKDAAMRFLGGPLYQLGGAYAAIADQANDAVNAANRYKHDLQAQGDAARAAAGDNEDNADSLDKVASKANKAASQLDRYKAAIDKIYGGQQSRIEDRIALKRMRAEGPDRSGSRGTGKNKVEFSTADDARLWAIDYAQQAAQYAGDFKSAGKQAQILAAAQAYIAKTVGQYGVGKPGQFASSLIGPDAATGTATRPWQNMYLPGAEEPGGATYNFVVQAQAGAVVDQIIKEGEKLAASSGGRFSGPTGRYGRGGAR